MGHSVASAIRSAVDYSDEILRETDPLTLIGPLYVLEGAREDRFIQNLKVRGQQWEFRQGCIMKQRDLML